MSTTRLKKSEWKKGIWVTRAAAVLGVVTISVGLADLRLYQVPVFSFLAIVVIVLSIVGIVMSLWRIERRSRRLRVPAFWLSLVANLLLLVSVGFLFHRSFSLPPMQKEEVQLPPAPE